jgi:hypothetical protein
MINKKKILSILTTVLLSGTSSVFADCGAQYVDLSTGKINSPADDFMCSLKKGTVGTGAKFESQLIQSVFPVEGLETYLANKVFGAIWGRFIPEPQNIALLQEILQDVRDLKVMVETLTAVMEQDFENTDAMISQLLKDIITFGDNSVFQYSKNTFKNNNDIVAKVADNSEFIKTLSDWSFPPYQPYLILSASIVEDNGLSDQGDFIVIENNSTLTEGQSWASAGSITFTGNFYSFSVKSGDAIMEQGNKGSTAIPMGLVTVFSFKKYYAEANPLDESAITVTSVTYKDGQLIFKGKRGTASSDEILGTLGLPSNYTANDGTMRPMEINKQFTKAIIYPDASFYAYVPSKTKTLPSGNITYHDIPWSNQRLDFFEQKIFTELASYEGWQDASKVDEKSTMTGALINAAINNVTTIYNNEGVVDIDALGDALNNMMGGYHDNVNALFAAAKYKLSDGAYILLDDGSEINLGLIALQYYQLYFEAANILSQFSQTLRYAYYYDPNIFVQFGVDKSQLGQQFTNALTKLSTTFKQGLTNYNMQAYTENDAAANGSINFNIIPGVSQSLRSYTSNDIAPLIYIPFTLDAALTDSDINNYIDIIESGDLVSLTTSNLPQPFVCALVGNYQNSKNNQVDCDDVSGAIPGGTAQFKVLNSAFNVLPRSPVDTTQSATNFATIELVSESQSSQGDSGSTTQYTYAVIVRFQATGEVVNTNSTYWDVIVNENFIIDTSVYEGYMKDVNALVSDVPSGNWTQFCKAPEDFTTTDENDMLSYGDIRSPFTVSCSVDKANKSYQRRSIVPGSCVDVDYNGKLTDIVINYDKGSHQLICGDVSEDFEDQIQTNLDDDVDTTFFDKNRGEISCDWRYITAIGKKATAQYDKNGYVSEYPNMTLSKVINYNPIVDGKRRDYCSRLASVVAASNKDEGYYINDAGYLWSTQDPTEQSWPEKITNIFPEGNWLNYCTQPFHIGSLLVTKCNGRQFDISNKACKNYNLVGKSEQNIGPKGLLYCADQSSKAIDSPLAAYNIKHGRFTQDMINNCAMPVLGLELDSEYIDIYCHANGNKNEWVKSSLPLHISNAYTFDSETGTVSVAPWSGICSAYIHETVNKGQDDEQDSVYCAKLNNKTNKLEKTISPQNNFLINKRLLGSAVFNSTNVHDKSHQPALPRCDLAYIGKGDPDQFKQNEYPFECYTIDFNSKANQAGHNNQLDAVNKLLEDPGKYYVFSLAPSGNVLEATTGGEHYVRAPGGPYLEQCTNIYAYGESTADPTMVKGYCDPNSNAESKLEYSNVCAANSPVNVDDKFNLYCSVEKGAPTVPEACKVISYQKDNPEKTQYLCDGETTEGQIENIIINQSDYDNYAKQCNTGAGIKVSEDNDGNLVPSGCLQNKDSQDFPQLPKQCIYDGGIPQFDQNGAIQITCGDDDYKINYKTQCADKSDISWVQNQPTCDEFKPEVIKLGDYSKNCTAGYDKDNRLFTASCTGDTEIKPLMADVCNPNAEITVYNHDFADGSFLDGKDNIVDAKALMLVCGSANDTDKDNVEHNKSLQQAVLNTTLVTTDFLERCYVLNQHKGQHGEIATATCYDQNQNAHQPSILKGWYCDTGSQITVNDNGRLSCTDWLTNSTGNFVNSCTQITMYYTGEIDATCNGKKQPRFDFVGQCDTVYGVVWDEKNQMLACQLPKDAPKLPAGCGYSSHEDGFVDGVVKATCDGKETTLDMNKDCLNYSVRTDDDAKGKLLCAFPKGDKGQRFVSGEGSGQDCIVDTEYNLFWLKDANKFNSGNEINWNDAMAKVKTFEACGYNDWRLPTIDDLDYLIVSSSEPDDEWLNSQGFMNIAPSAYWTSTLDTAEGYVRTVNMKNGNYVSYPKDSGVPVLPVRGPNDH